MEEVTLRQLFIVWFIPLVLITFSGDILEFIVNFFTNHR